ncbi:MAG: LLM class flavin-dependent oxidoreductase [Dehalococcoidia bacterium]|nr:LLM class flavin-dependent oxidoreductase [Dehalococcoidia bacterium]
MFQMYFTEQPMSAYPVAEGNRLGYTSTIFPNQYFDPQAAARLYQERLTEYLYADDLGFDGIMLNEHHNAPFCMQAKINIFASVLAGATKKTKLVLLGNPLPVSDNPVRLAEEIGMIDLISQGRLVSGFVRGAGQEQLATNTNPAFNRERFEEAHDLIIKTWTQPGPFRWEGDHYQLRLVNPWVRTLQQPHPRIWIPGVISTETIVWSAEHRYPYIALNPTMDDANRIWSIYDKAAERVGYKSGPEQRGYLIRCHVQDTDEKAIENARQFMWMQGEFIGLGAFEWQNPSGYSSPSGRRQRLAGPKRAYPGYEEQLAGFLIIAGSPKTVIQKLRKLLEGTRASILALWGNDGMINHKDSMNCIKLLAQEVCPAVQQIGDELGLKSPFELNTPVSLAATPKEQLRPVPVM